MDAIWENYAPSRLFYWNQRAIWYFSVMFHLTRGLVVVKKVCCGHVWTDAVMPSHTAPSCCTEVPHARTQRVVSGRSFSVNWISWPGHSLLAPSTFVRKGQGCGTTDVCYHLSKGYLCGNSGSFVTFQGTWGSWFLIPAGMFGKVWIDGCVLATLSMIFSKSTLCYHAIQDSYPPTPRPTPVWELVLFVMILSSLSYLHSYYVWKSWFFLNVSFPENV